MIFADFQTNLALVLVLAGTTVWLAVGLVVAAVVGLARHAHKDYRRKGGAPALAKKAAAHGAAAVLKRLIFGRWR